jgi:hypothetical protein
MNRGIAFVSLEDQEKQQLEEFANLSYIERFEYLIFLQKSNFNVSSNIDVDDINRNFIVLSRKNDGA